MQSNKHEITWSFLGQDASAPQNVVLVQGVKSADADLATEVEVGHSVPFIYLEFHFSPAQTGVVKIIHWQVEVVISGMSQGNPSSYYQNDRSFIIQRGMEMLPNNVATVFKRIVPIRVPKLYQRVKNNTFISFRYQSSSTEQINTCGFAIYKEKS